MSSSFHSRTLLGALVMAVNLQAAKAQQALDPIKVIADPYSQTVTEGTSSYTSEALTVGSKLPSSIRETPQSVSVITRQRIEEQNLLTLDTALLQTPGISVQNQTVSDSGFFARGFLVQTGQIDGLPWTLGTNNYAYASPDLALFDHVEVLRGSAGLFTGAGNPGAVINLVRKRPLFDSQLKLAVNAGSWNQTRVEVDANSPIFADGPRARMVAVYEDRDYFYDVAESQKALIYGVLEHDVTESTRVTIGGTYQQFDTLPMHGVALPRMVGGASVDLPRSTFLGAAWNRNDIETRQFFGDLEHRFSEHWNLKIAATDHHSTTDYKLAFLLGAIDPVTGAGAFQRGNYVDGREDQTGAEAVLTGAFTAFGRHHEVVVGANWSDRTSYYDVLALYSAPYTPVDIYNYDPYAVPEPATPASPGANEQRTEQSGIYATLRTRLADPLTLIVGGRTSEWKFRQHNVRTGIVASAYDDTAFTPHAGLVYDLNSVWSAYASYAEIFQVQNNFDFDRNRLDPIVGGTYEVGLKGEFYAGRLNTTLAVFHSLRENVAQPDPRHTGPTECDGRACYVAEGKQKSEGVEVEISGMLLPQWNLFAGYTYNTNEYVRDRTATGAPSANEGQPLMSYTPEHLFRLWSNYQLQGGFSIGAGVSAQTRFYRILNSNTVYMNQPGYELWSARLGYRINDRWSAALNGNNLLDEKYYSRMNLVDQGSVYGEPRNFMVSLQGRF